MRRSSGTRALCAALLAAVLAPARALRLTRRGAFGAALAPLAPRPAVAAPPPYCDEAVSAWRRGQQTVYIVGTAHVSTLSAELVANTFDAVKPTLLMVELDNKRVKGFGGETSAAPAPRRKPSLAERAGAFLVGSVISSLYKSLDQLGLDTGAEFSTALRRARATDTPVLLADRDVDETLARLSSALQATSPEAVARLDTALGQSIAGDLKFSADTKQAVSDSVELIKKRSTVRAIVGALKASTPELYSALVDERDAYMTDSLLDRLSAASGPQRVVAVVGMAHEDGISRRLASRGFAAPRLACS